MQSAAKLCLTVKPQGDADRVCGSSSTFEELSIDELEGVVGSEAILLSWPPDWEAYFRKNPELLYTRVVPLAEWEQGKGRYGGRWVKPVFPE